MQLIFCAGLVSPRLAEIPGKWSKLLLFPRIISSRRREARLRDYELAKKNLLDFAAIEEWWISRVKEFFESKPFGLKVDPSKSIRSIVADLIEAAFARQRECPGVMTACAVLQHLVGAKIGTALPDARIDRRSMLSIRDSLLLTLQQEERETSSSAIQPFM